MKEELGAGESENENFSRQVNEKYREITKYTVFPLLVIQVRTTDLKCFQVVAL